MNITDFQNSIQILYGNNIFFYLAALIEIIFKGFALWKAAILREKNWFVALLLINSVGILPIFYLILRRDKTTN